MTPTRSTLKTTVHEILPDLGSYLDAVNETVGFDSMKPLQQAKVLTDVLLDFGTFSADCDPEAVAYVAALNYTGVL